MPSRSAIKVSLSLFAVSALLSAAATFTYKEWLRPSDAEMKNLSLKIEKEPLRRTKKLQPGFNVRIESESDSVESPHRLKAIIESKKSFASVSYVWLLPAGVEIVGGGNIQGTVMSTDPREPSVVSATFVTSSEENQQIHIRVTVQDGPRQMVQTAQYNTRDQKMIDLQREELAKRNREYIIDYESNENR